MSPLRPTLLPRPWTWLLPPPLTGSRSARPPDLRRPRARREWREAHSGTDVKNVNVGVAYAWWSLSVLPLVAFLIPLLSQIGWSRCRLHDTERRQRLQACRMAMCCAVLYCCLSVDWTEDVSIAAAARVTLCSWGPCGCPSARSPVGPRLTPGQTIVCQPADLRRTQPPAGRCLPESPLAVTRRSGSDAKWHASERRKREQLLGAVQGRVRCALCCN